MLYFLKELQFISKRDSTGIFFSKIGARNACGELKFESMPAWRLPVGRLPAKGYAPRVGTVFPYGGSW